MMKLFGAKLFQEIQNKLTIGLVYRSPSINEEDNTKIKTAIKEVSKGECIIMGDFNHGHIQWNSLEITGSEDQQFLFLIQDSFLTQNVLESTRGENVLDIVLSSQKESSDTKWIDVGSPVDIIYLDFQKALDKVPHQRLLLKLKAHGIGIGITDRIEQWLTDRRQRVVVDGEVSNWISVLSGVPQGSVLGPILFLIYINDLDDSITSNVLEFADDTKLFRKVNTDGDKQHLQNDLDRLVKMV